MKKVIASYTLSVFFLILGIMSFVQASNPNFLTSADTVNTLKIPSGVWLSISGIVFIIIAAILLIVRILSNTKKR